MRHVFLSGAITARPCGMVETAAATLLIALLGLLLLHLPRSLRATFGAIALSAVTTAADVNLAAAASTQVESGVRFQQDSQTNRERWTPFPMNGTLSPLSSRDTAQFCSHGQVRYGTAPALSVNTLVLTHPARIVCVGNRSSRSHPQPVLRTALSWLPKTICKEPEVPTPKPRFPLDLRGF
jgi:hypothetical protein